MSAPVCRPRRGGGDTGQATVEFVLVLPLVLVLILGVIQVALIGRDQVAVAHAAREAARASAVDPDPASAVAAARGVVPGAVVTVAARPPVGSQIRVVVRYRSPTDVPLVGAFLPDVDLSAAAVMRVER